MRLESRIAGLVGLAGIVMCCFLVLHVAWGVVPCGVGAGLALISGLRSRIEYREKDGKENMLVFGIKALLLRYIIYVRQSYHAVKPCSMCASAIMTARKVLRAFHDASNPAVHFS